MSYNILMDPTGLTVIGGVAAAAFTVFQATSWYKNHVEAKYGKVLDIFLDATSHTYVNYVQALKQSSTDGTITIEEARIAREQTWVKAKAIAADRGVDLVKAIGGEDARFRYIEQAVTALKPTTK